MISTKSGLKRLGAKIFIDCTGDGDMAAFAGAEFIAGDGRGVFQPGTLRYYPVVDAQDKILNYGDNRNHVPINITDSDSITKSEIASRKMIFEQMKRGDRIMAVAPAVAPREGRRIKGITEMNLEDYYNGQVFEDSVCYSYWFVDIHREGQAAYIKYITHDKTPTIRLSAMISKDLSNLMMAGRCVSSDRETNSSLRVKASCMAMGQAAYIKYITHDKTPTIRLSSMISNDIDNLMMAGRCVSSDRETNSSLRVKASCMAMGQAAGTAAAIAVRDGVDAVRVPADKVKQALDENGAIIPGKEKRFEEVI